jgi:hypothetical protein
MPKIKIIFKLFAFLKYFRAISKNGLTGLKRRGCNQMVWLPARFPSHERQG